MHIYIFIYIYLYIIFRYSDKDIKGDKNLKDFILFFKKDFHVVSTMKDNTGNIYVFLPPASRLFRLYVYGE
jgi:hypothetical protein